MTNRFRLARAALGACLALSLTGCFLFKSEAERAAEREAYKAAMDAKVGVWVGKTTAELLAQEGPPTVVLDDPSGMKIWAYTTETSELVPGHITITKSGDTVTASQARGRVETSKSSRMFWIGKDGRIAKVAWHEK